MSSLTDRMIRAAKLDVNVYEEVEADKSAMGQAMWVVVLSSVAAGIGSIGTTGIYGLLIGTIVALIGWFIWAFIILILLGLRHPRPIDTYLQLDFKRKCVALLALLVLIGTFIHTPIELKHGEEIRYEEILEQSI